MNIPTEENKLTSGPTLLGQKSVLVTVLASDLVLVAEVLGSNAHGGLLGVAIDQGSSQGILELQVDTEAGAAKADAAESIGSQGHGLGTAGQDNVGVASNDLVGSVDDGLETRSAETVDSQGGDGDVES